MYFKRGDSKYSRETSMLACCGQKLLICPSVLDSPDVSSRFTRCIVSPPSEFQWYSRQSPQHSERTKATVIRRCQQPHTYIRILYNPLRTTTTGGFTEALMKFVGACIARGQLFVLKFGFSLFRVFFVSDAASCDFLIRYHYHLVNA